MAPSTDGGRRILVTGVGFIGGHRCAAFVRDDHDVVALDNVDPDDDTGTKTHPVSIAPSVAEEGDGTQALVGGAVPDTACQRHAISRGSCRRAEATDLSITS